MASQRQIAANRRNSLRSTGPTTIEGKTRVAANAVRHGFYAHKFTVGEESREQFNAVHLDFLQEFKPVGPAEISLVQQLTLAHWRILRAHALIAEAYDTSIERLASNGGKATAENAFRNDLSGAQEILHLERLLASAERSFRYSLRELLKLQEDLVEPGCPIEDTVKLIEFPDEEAATAGAGATDQRQSGQTTPQTQQPAPQAATPEVLPDQKVIGWPYDLRRDAERVQMFNAYREQSQSQYRTGRTKLT